MKSKTQEANNIFIRPRFFGKPEPIPHDIRSLQKKEINKNENEIIPQKILPDNLGTFSDLSTIQKKDSISSFFSKINPKKNEIRRLLYHIKMNNFINYATLLNVLTEGKYRYFITYEYNQEYYIQISLYRAKRLDNPN